jgi:eukaryotic-like serine/threonine-protein kinase
MHATTDLPCGAIDGFVRAFETARANGDGRAIREFLPSPDHPHYDRIVRELVRIDLELGWDAGRPRSLDDYVRDFPTAFAQPSVVQEVAFEEYRQRRNHGERPALAEYSNRFGVSTDGWSIDSPTMPADSGYGWQSLTQIIDPKSADSAVVPEAARDAADLYQAMRRSDPQAAERLVAAVSQLPVAGSDFLNFRLAVELGRGAFGRVFLANDLALARRTVALKISARLESEPQMLARLQHTNIVPIFSVHHSGAFQAICMPYLGSTTLVDVLRGVRQAPSVPASGRHVISTINNRHSRTHENAASPARENDPPAQTAPPPASPLLQEKFGSISYVEAILWMMSRLADGLAHAHERGVLHRDLKPANVLLSDDGQPMLLDFNLSEEAHLSGHAAGARIGGTLPYMAPEQLESFQGVARRVDARSDVFALGVIAFELLTGRHPFGQVSGPLFELVPRLLAAHQKSPPRLRSFNAAVSPAAEAIIRRCLEPDPKRRYQSAAQLREDLERHLKNEPLRHTAEPSLRERVLKWSRRHPRLSSSSTVALAAAVFMAVSAAVALSYWRGHQRELDRLAAGETLNTIDRLTHDQRSLEYVSGPNAAAGISDTSQAALARYGVLENPNWRQVVDAHLEPDDQRHLRQSAGEALLGWADAERVLGEREHSVERLALAWNLNERATESFDGPSRSVRRQRAELARLLQRPDAGELAAAAAKTPNATASDYFNAARDLLKQQEIRKAMPLLVEATRLDPRHFWAWHFLGNCYYEMLEYEQAIACYSACIGLAQDPSAAHFQFFGRALVYIAQGRHADAEADLNQSDKGLTALPVSLVSIQRAKTALQRAKIRAARKDLKGAEQVLTDALEIGAMETQLFLERSRIREKRGDKTGAERDRAEVLRIEPSDPLGWNERGLARIETDPAGALADFDRALALDPTTHFALQNKAHVLSEHLKRPADGLKTLDRLIDLYPGYVQARIGRAVVLARQGRRAEAVADVADSLARDRSAPTLYQAANVYALTSRQNPSDADRVIPLLAAALWNGFGLDLIDGDTDMDPVRGQPAFRQLIAVVRELRKELRRDEQ